jgi:hypothetical protein
MPQRNPFFWNSSVSQIQDCLVDQHPKPAFLLLGRHHLGNTNDVNQIGLTTSETLPFGHKGAVMSNGMIDQTASLISLLTVLATTSVTIGLYLLEKCLLLQGAMVNLSKLPTVEKIGSMATVLLVVNLRTVETTALVEEATLSERVASGSGEAELLEILHLVVGVSTARGIGTLYLIRTEVTDVPIAGVGMGLMIGMVSGTEIWGLTEMQARVGRVARIGIIFLVGTTDAFKAVIMMQAAVDLAAIVFREVVPQGIFFLGEAFQARS